MRIVKTLTTGILIVVCIVGCGKKSTLEGKVVDGKGQPVSGIKMIAKQTQPIKGYEQFEATTGLDGGFKFSKLFPTSEYELVPYTDKYLAEAARIKLESGPEGQTKLLPAPLELRFATQKEGIVTDTKTGLMWARNANIAGRKMNWTEAINWAQLLNYAGYNSGWRLPTKEELEQVIKIDGHVKVLKGFSNVQSDFYDFYWSSTPHDDLRAYAWGISIGSGRVDGIGKAASFYVWPVRGVQ